MTDGEPVSLGLEQVVQRFADSEQTLRDIRSNIDRLSSLEEKTEASAKALEESARAVAEYTEEAKEITSELAETSRAARELLSRAKEVLDGSQFRRIEKLITGGNAKVETVQERQDKHFKSLQRSIETVDGAVSSASSRLVEELDQSEKLHAIGESVEGTASSVEELSSKFLSELQTRLRSTEDTMTADNRKIRWLIIVIILLQAGALLGMIFFDWR